MGHAELVDCSLPNWKDVSDELFMKAAVDELLAGYCCFDQEEFKQPHWLCRMKLLRFVEGTG